MPCRERPALATRGRATDCGCGSRVESMGMHSRRWARLRRRLGMAQGWGVKGDTSVRRFDFQNRSSPEMQSPCRFPGRRQLPRTAGPGSTRRQTSSFPRFPIELTRFRRGRIDSQKFLGRRATAVLEGRSVPYRPFARIPRAGRARSLLTARNQPEAESSFVLLARVSSGDRMALQLRHSHWKNFSPVETGIFTASRRRARQARLAAIGRVAPACG